MIGAAFAVCACDPAESNARLDAASTGRDGSVTRGVDASIDRADAIANVACAERAQLSGTTRAPNGDPIPGVGVYLTRDTRFPSLTDGVECDRCAGEVSGAIASARSELDGSFALESAALDMGGMFTLVVRSGAFRHVERDIRIDPCGRLELPRSATTLPGSAQGDDTIPRIVVASSSRASEDVNDRFASVLDRLGIDYDRVEPAVDGIPTGDDLFALLSDSAALARYRIVAIPCGALGDFEVLPNLTPTMIQNLQTWLANGGRLYSSDLAYSVVATALPDSIVFATGPSPEPYADDAVVGIGVTGALDADVDDPRLLSWLETVGAVRAGQTTIPVTDLRDPWAAIDNLSDAALAPDAMGRRHAEVLVSGAVQWHTGGGDHHPLTVRVDVPDSDGTYCGRVVFTSYHVESSGSSALTAQERVLEYLFFELSECIDDVLY